MNVRAVDAVKYIQKTFVSYRRGVVIDDSPFTVSIGDDDNPYVDPPTLGSGGSIGDAVHCLKWRTGILVLSGAAGPPGPPGADGADGAIGPPGPTENVITPIYNVVLDYGADDTGAANTAPEIQAALDDCNAAGGGIVYVPEGTYKVTTSLTVYTGTVLKGAFGGNYDALGLTKIKKTNGDTNGDAVMWVHQGCRIEDLWLDTQTVVDFLSATPGDFAGLTSYGIKGVESGGTRDDTVIVNCFARDFAQAGVGGYFSTARLEGCTLATNQYGIYTATGSDLTLVDCTLRHNARDGAYVAYNYLRATNCRIEWNARYGLYDLGGEATIVGNLFDRNGWSGVRLGDSGSFGTGWGSVITGNYFSRNGATDGHYGRAQNCPAGGSKYLAPSTELDKSHIQLNGARYAAVSGNRYRAGRDDSDGGAMSPKYIYSTDLTTAEANFVGNNEAIGFVNSQPATDYPTLTAGIVAGAAVANVSDGTRFHAGGTFTIGAETKTVLSVAVNAVTITTTFGSNHSNGDTVYVDGPGAYSYDLHETPRYITDVPLIARPPAWSGRHWVISQAVAAGIGVEAVLEMMDSAFIRFNNDAGATLSRLASGNLLASFIFQSGSWMIANQATAAERIVLGYDAATADEGRAIAMLDAAGTGWINMLKRVSDTEMSSPLKLTLSKQNALDLTHATATINFGGDTPLYHAAPAQLGLTGSMLMSSFMAVNWIGAATAILGFDGDTGLNGQALSALNAAGNGWVTLIKRVSDTLAQTGAAVKLKAHGLDADSQKVTSVADATANADGVNLGQLNNAAGAPTVIDTADTFTVPANRQVLYALAIQVDGTLAIDGELVEV